MTSVLHPVVSRFRYACINASCRSESAAAISPIDYTSSVLPTRRPAAVGRALPQGDAGGAHDREEPFAVALAGLTEETDEGREHRVGEDRLGIERSLGPSQQVRHAAGATEVGVGNDRVELPEL